MASRREVFLAALACVLLAGHAAGQDSDQKPRQQDELHFNGNRGDNSQQTPSQPSQPLPRPPSPSQYSNEDDDDYSREQPSRPQVLPDYSPFGGFGNGNLFGGLQDTFPIPPPFNSLFGDLLGTINRPFRDMHRNFERQFQDLERLAGEGQDVSYFNRNGIEYVRTCTTKKVSGNDGGKQQSQMLPYQRQGSRRGLDQQQQQSQEQTKSDESPEKQVTPASPANQAASSS